MKTAVLEIILCPRTVLLKRLAPATKVLRRGAGSVSCRARVGSRRICSISAAPGMWAARPPATGEFSFCEFPEKSLLDRSRPGPSKTRVPSHPFPWEGVRGGRAFRFPDSDAVSFLEVERKRVAIPAPLAAGRRLRNPSASRLEAEGRCWTKIVWRPPLCKGYFGYPSAYRVGRLGRRPQIRLVSSRSSRWLHSALRGQPFC